MPSRASNQFNNLTNGTNLASVSKRLRKEKVEQTYRAEINDVLSTDLSVIKKYEKIKNNPSLNSDDLSDFLYENGGRGTPKEVIYHFSDLRKQEILKKYQEIKDDPNLKSDDLSGFVYNHDGRGTPKEVVDRFSDLRRQEILKKYQEIKDDPNLKSDDLKGFVYDYDGLGTPKQVTNHFRDLKTQESGI